jgi:cytochrome c oxidase cbb3-type subunit III
MTRTVWAGAATALLLIAAGYDSVGRTGDAAASVAPAAVGAAVDAHELGRAVYNFRCYFCHGYSGDARTLAASYLAPPPRDFRAASAADLPRERIAAAVRTGREGTAMKSFGGILSDAEIDAVAGFVAREFVLDKASNTAYHTAENGWPGHQKFALAFPFARGERALDTPVDALTASEREGRQLYMASCVSCHDRGRVVDEGPAWSARPVSYPRMGFEPGQANPAPVDAVSSASIYAKHEVVPKVPDLTPRQRRGEALFQANCAFCHGGDGTGKNWIGQFMEPKARDLTQYSAQTLPPQRLRQVIRDGLPGTSMPAWRAVLKPAEIDAIGAYVERVMFTPGPAAHSTALRR